MGPKIGLFRPFLMRSLMCQKKLVNTKLDENILRIKVFRLNKVNIGTNLCGL